MKSKGFTLVELLAVISILAILVIIAIPKVMDLFNNARKKSFEIEIRNIYKQAKSEYMQQNAIGPRRYCDSKTKEIKKDCNELDITSSKISYYVELDGSGNVKYIGVEDGNFSYGSDNVEKIENINSDDIKPKSDNVYFNLVEQTITSPVDPEKYKELKITLNNTSYTNKEQATKELIVNYGQIIPKVTNLPVANFVVTVINGSDNSETKYDVSGILKGWYTNSVNGQRIIDEAGNVVPNVNGYTDSEGNYIKTNDLVLFAQWTGGEFQRPDIPCTSSIFTTPDWYQYYYDKNGRVYQFVSHNNGKFSVLNDLFFKRNCQTTVEFEYNYNGGTGTNYSIRVPMTEKEKITTPIQLPTKDSNYFEGWYLDSALTKKFTDENARILANVSGYTDSNINWISSAKKVPLYAKWTPTTFYFNYTGNFSYQVENAGWIRKSNTSIIIKQPNWQIKFLTDGSLMVKSISGNADVFLVGGGGGAGGCNLTTGGGGGGGGFTTTKTDFNLATTTYPIDIGSGGGCGSIGNPSTAFGFSAPGGYSGRPLYANYGSNNNNGGGGNGGSGGGGAFGGNGWPSPTGDGGSNGSNGLNGRYKTYASNGDYNIPTFGGSGCANNNGCKINGMKCNNTRAFCEPSNDLYAGGGAGSDDEYCGACGAGGGGGGRGNTWCVCGCQVRPTDNSGGGGANGPGASGIVILRNHR